MNVPSLQYLRPLRLNQCHCWRRRGPIPNPQSRWARLAVDGENKVMEMADLVKYSDESNVKLEDKLLLERGALV